MIARYLLALLCALVVVVVPALADTGSEHCGTGWCLTAIYDSTAQNINYTLVVDDAGASSGWYGVGQGEQMSGANMMVGWVNSDSTITTSQRGATANKQPLTSDVTATAYTVNAAETKLTTVNGTSGLSISWLFAQTTTPGSSMAHMYAHSTTTPSSSSSDATIVKHNEYYQFTMDMTAAVTTSSSGTASVSSSGSSSSSTSSSSSSSSDSGSDSQQDSVNRDLSSNQTRIMLVHMIFMCVAWLLLAPLGFLITRYGRTLFRWYPWHRNVQYGTILLTFIAFFLAVAWLCYDGGPQFSKTHHKVGLAITILALAQGALGLGAHRLITKSGNRYAGFVHAPIGLLLFGLSIWNIITGFALWDWGPSSAAMYFVYGWTGLVVLLYLVGFIFIPREIKQSRANYQEKRGLQPMESLNTTNSQIA